MFSYFEVGGVYADFEGSETHQSCSLQWKHSCLIIRRSCLTQHCTSSSSVMYMMYHFCHVADHNFYTRRQTLRIKALPTLTKLHVSAFNCQPHFLKVCKGSAETDLLCACNTAKSPTCGCVHLGTNPSNLAQAKRNSVLPSVFVLHTPLLQLLAAWPRLIQN